MSPRLVVVFSSRALMGERQFPQHFQFVGPSLGPRPQNATFPWEWIEPDRARILVTLGTVNASAGGRFFDSVIEALSDSNVQVIMVAPEDLQFAALPKNILIRSRIPQLEVLPHVNAVVCHAGHNTVCETLAHGLPLVLTPIKDDQSVVAQQVVDAGAGIRLKFGRFAPPQLSAAVERVLGERSFREAADRIRESFETAGGAPRVAELLEGLTQL
jgi:MGT family glycosyltransferase